MENYLLEISLSIEVSGYIFNVSLLFDIGLTHSNELFAKNSHYINPNLILNNEAKTKLSLFRDRYRYCSIPKHQTTNPYPTGFRSFLWLL